ncbi:MAG: hypothetical protein WC532_07635 [Candidatus Omnitrophota bacterium]
MEEKEFPKPGLGGNVVAEAKSKFSGFLSWLFSFTKFLFGVFLLPFVYGSTVAFLKQFNGVTSTGQTFFWSGAISFLLVYLFICEPLSIYTRGHKILEWVFSFFRPLVKVAPYLLPIYTILLGVLYLIIASVAKSADLTNNFVFLFGFTLSLHLVFSAKTLRSKKGDFLKGNYIFGFSFVYITSILILSFFLSLSFEKFSFVSLSNQAYQIGRGIIIGVFNQLFSVKA